MKSDNNRIVIVLCIILAGADIIYSCDKLNFHVLSGLRGEGVILQEDGDTSMTACRRMCRLIRECYRFNFQGGDLNSGRCQLLKDFTGYVNDTGWACYVTCPDEMDYHQVTGTCFGLLRTRHTFEEVRTRCRAWGPVAHLADIDSALENDIAEAYLHQLDSMKMFIGGMRPDGVTAQDAFYWITTGELFTYDNWDSTRPTTQVTRQCVILTENNGIVKWSNAPCNFAQYALCES